MQKGNKNKNYKIRMVPINLFILPNYQLGVDPNKEARKRQKAHRGPVVLLSVFISTWEEANIKGKQPFDSAPCCSTFQWSGILFEICIENRNQK